MHFCAYTPHAADMKQAHGKRAQRQAPTGIRGGRPGSGQRRLNGLRPVYCRAVKCNYPSRSAAGSASATRQAGAWKGSAKYWVSCATRSSANSMTLTE